MARKTTVRVNIPEVSKAFILDSGSVVSLIQPDIHRGEVRPSSSTSFGVTGEAVYITGEQELQFFLNNWNYRHTFCFCSLPTQADGDGFCRKLTPPWISEGKSSGCNTLPYCGYLNRIRGANGDADYAAISFPK